MAGTVAIHALPVETWLMKFRFALPEKLTAPRPPAAKPKRARKK